MCIASKPVRVIKSLPKVEQYALVPQMRRAAISITNNIAEGHGRWHFQENIQFCRVARGSVEEAIDDLNLCLDGNYGERNEVLRIKEEAYALVARINGYIAYLNRTKQAG